MEKNTTDLSLEFIENGFKTHICSIDTSKIPKNLIDTDYSVSFFNQLPKDIDPCGENGEFHRFCYAGPIYKENVSFQKNGIVEKTYTHDGTEFLYLFSDLS